MAEAEGSSQPLRVLHVMESTIGGTRRHLRDVAAVQAAAGHRVHVVAAALRMPEVRGDFQRLREAGVDVRELPMVRAIQPATDARHLGQLRRILREVRPDVVHTHSSKAGVLGRLASKSTGIGARVHTPHTFAFLFDAMFSGAKRRLFRTIESQLGRHTHRLVAVSESERATIAESGVVDVRRVRVVPNGVDPQAFRGATPVDRGALGVPAEAPLLATVGLLNVAKGQDLALEALARPEAAAVHLLIVGHGEEREALGNLARQLGLEERVHFLGWRDDVPGLLATCDGLLLPSRWEGMAYIVLEAMAAGLPIVATRVDGARELVTEGVNGTLAEVGDSADLARAIG
ncbi:MAG: glycosyltransferase family 4 protein, partial [Planctomycetota bacterium]